MSRSMPPDQYRYNEASGWYERRSVNEHGEVSWFPLDSVEEELNRLYHELREAIPNPHEF